MFYIVKQSDTFIPTTPSVPGDGVFPNPPTLIFPLAVRSTKQTVITIFAIRSFQAMISPMPQNLLGTGDWSRMHK
jgi:hypothetical protein